MALLSLVDNLTKAVENGEHVFDVYLDFSKAFDTVDHMILLEKLYHYGVRGCAHDWFTSYLSKGTFLVLFADDSTLFLSGKSADYLQQMINDELKDLVIWLRANKLSLNISKTHYMLFSNKNVIQPNVTIEINGQPITCVTKAKFLGVIIDNKLTRKEVRKYLNKNTLLDLCY